jgi:hypothetical protein
MAMKFSEMTHRISTYVKKSANSETSVVVMHNKSKYPAHEKFKNKFHLTVSAYGSARERLLAPSVVILNVVHNTLLQNISEKGHFNVSGKENDPWKELIPNTKDTTR